MSFESPKAFPLFWPLGWTRTAKRVASQFKTGLPAAKTNVQNSLKRFADISGKKITDLVISSNASLMDEKPADPGVAVWFTWDEMQVCIAVDRYEKLQDNLQAIHHILEARITETRHGGLNIIRQTFKGFVPQLPGFNPWEVLDLPPTASEVAIERAYKYLAGMYHPDNKETGDEQKFIDVKRAYEAAKPKVQTPAGVDIKQP